VKYDIEEDDIEYEVTVNMKKKFSFYKRKVDGLLHRESGPAIESWGDLPDEYYCDGIKYKCASANIWKRKMKLKAFL
jgi:hypothetical protein